MTFDLTGSQLVNVQCCTLVLSLPIH